MSREQESSSHQGTNPRMVEYPAVPLGPPPKQGLYDPRNEHDACGVGFVVNVKGHKSHRILEQAIQVLKNLDHRGACGCEVNTGDGAGVLLQMPHAFNEEVCRKARIHLPAIGQYGSGIIFLPRNPTVRRQVEQKFEQVVQSEGQTVLGWRTVPTSNGMLGETARSCEPFMRQVFIQRNADIDDDLAFERKLYVIRKRAYNEIRTSTLAGAEYWYIVSLSARTIVFKGMLLTTQLDQYFQDLHNPLMETALALVHRASAPIRSPAGTVRIHTATSPTTARSTRSAATRTGCMPARPTSSRQPSAKTSARSARSSIPTAATRACSTTRSNCSYLSGRSLPHAVMMMIPEPWSNHDTMDDHKRAFYQYHSSLMEPWDGPASISFTDGTQIGAVLDRNGLRPGRYYVTKDDLVIMASEAGVLDVPAADIVRKGRLQPGRMFLVDTAQGRIIEDDEIKHSIATERPYREWLEEYQIHVEDLPQPPDVPQPDPDTLLQRQVAFGYSFEDQRIVIAPMASEGVEAIGSMGNDTPLAVLSNKPRLLYDYFKQLFAQVTNPPIDCIREEIVTSAETRLGSEGNLLNPQPIDCRRLELKWPIVTNEEFARIRRMDLPGLRVGVLPILFRVSRGEKGLVKSMEELRLMARRLIEEEEVNVIILSDRGVNKDFAPIPALMAVAGLHHYLIREGLRTRASLVLETGEAREVHHFSLLIGYGVSAINPYLAFETIDQMIREGMLTGIDHKSACKNFVKAAAKGVIKVASKMGISSLQSYRGAQVFEALGLRQDVIDEYFSWTASRIGGIGTDVIAQEVLMRHAAAFPDRSTQDRHTLPVGGQYQWRAEGEYHLFNPESIHRLQKAVRTGSYPTFRAYSALVNDQASQLATLRGLLDFKPSDAIPLDEVESVESIMQRFKTGAMSYGSISKEAHETLAIAMNRIGGKSNTGEGGEDPERYAPMANGDSKNSAIKQVASGRFGVTSEYLVSAREIQIKMAQGAKPGEGGQLPGTKVYPSIAEDAPYDRRRRPDLAAAASRYLFDRGPRGADPRPQECESPRTHQRQARGRSRCRHDCRRCREGARRRGADQRSRRRHGRLTADLDHARRPAVGTRPRRNTPDAGAQQPAQPYRGRDRRPAQDRTRCRDCRAAGRRRIRLRDGTARRDRLHPDACLPPEHAAPSASRRRIRRLREKFEGKPEHVVNFMRFIAMELREIMAQLGFRTIEEMVGRVDKLEAHKAVDHWKAQGPRPVDPAVFARSGSRLGPLQPGCTGSRHRELARHDDAARICCPAIERGEDVVAKLPIRNVNRVAGTITGSEITRKYGAKGLPADTIRCTSSARRGRASARSCRLA